MNLTSLVPLAYRLLALVLLAIALFAAGVVHGMKLGEKDLDDYRAAELKATIVAAATAAEKTKAMQAQKDKALHDAQQRSEANARAAAAARTESDGLRADLAQARGHLPDAPIGTVRRYADTAASLLAECADRYSGMAATADSERGDALMLLGAWPTQKKD